MMTRRKRRDLTVDEIIANSGPILRAEGESALSMRRVAKLCGVTPMALYHHVTTKDVLVNLVMDAIVAEVLDPASGASVPWDQALLDFCGRLRRVMVDNPGAGLLWVKRPLVTPNMARVTERLFALLGAGGITGDDAAEAADALVLLIVGAVAYDLSRPPEIRRKLAGHIPESDTPLMAAILPTYSARDPDARYDDAMRWMLDGIVRRAAPL